jgi:uncharacterized protein (DUF305 family)
VVEGLGATGPANLGDLEITSLCRTIISGQQAEIDQMKAKLRQLGE